MVSFNKNYIHTAPSKICAAHCTFLAHVSLVQVSSSQSGENEVSLGEAWAVRGSVISGCLCYGRGRPSACGSAAAGPPGPPPTPPPPLEPGPQPEPPPPDKATARHAPWAGCCPIKGLSTSPWSSRRLRRGTSRASAPDTRSTGEMDVGGVSCDHYSAGLCLVCCSGVSGFIQTFQWIISLMSTLSPRGTNQWKQVL